MSYWSNNPEAYDEIIHQEMIRRGKATEDEDPFEAGQRLRDDPDEVDIVSTAEREYWADRIDDAKLRAKEERLK
jgi:hypothetical protein